MNPELLAPFTGEVCGYCGALLRVDDRGRTCAACRREEEEAYVAGWQRLKSSPDIQDAIAELRARKEARLRKRLRLGAEIAVGCMLAAAALWLGARVTLWLSR